MAAVGIDLGSEVSTVATLMKSNKPGASAKGRQVCILSNDGGDLVTPTWVAFKGNQFFVGNDVTDNMRIMNAKNTISNFKWMLGKKFADADVQAFREVAPYQLIEMPTGDVGVRVMFKDEETDFSITSLMGMYLTKLKEISVFHLEGHRDVSQPLDAVISVPPYFTNAQRQALLDAAKIGGLHVLRIMSDVSAIAYEYGFPRLTLPADTPTYVMVFQMGHMYTTVGVLELKKNNFRVVAQPTVMIGGSNIDLLLMRYTAKLFEDKFHETGVLQNPRYRMRFLVAAHKCKKVLSANAVAQFTVENILDRDFSVMIKRQDLEGLIAPMLPELEALFRRALTEAGITDIAQVSSLEMVGGSTRVPLIRQTVERIFGRPLSTTLNSEECIPRGCCLQSVQLSPFFSGRDITLVDCYPYAVRVSWPLAPGETGDNALDVFSSNCKIPQTLQDPVSKLLSFRRKGPFALIAEYHDASLPANTATQISRIDINDLPCPPTEEKGVLVKVRLVMDLNGIIRFQDAFITEEYEVEEVIPPEPKKKEEKKPAPAAQQPPPATSPAPAASPAPATSPAPPATSSPAPAATATEPAAAPMDVEPPTTPQEPLTPPAHVPASPPPSPQVPPPTPATSVPPQSPEAAPAPVPEAAPAPAPAAPAPAPVEAKPEPPKTRLVKKKRNVTLKARVLGQELPQEILQAFVERHLQMLAEERLRIETMDAKNTLEQYTYQIPRDCTPGGKLHAYLSDQDRAALFTKMETARQWLECDGQEPEVTKSAFLDRVATLTAYLQPAQARLREFEDRPQAAATFLDATARLKAMAAAPERAHIEKAKLDDVVKHIDEAMAWLDAKMTAQNALPQFAPPALTCADIGKKSEELRKYCEPILNTPKPAPPPPPKKEEPKPAAAPAPAPAADAPAATNTAPAPAEAVPAEAATGVAPKAEEPAPAAAPSTPSPMPSPSPKSPEPSRQPMDLD
ncbi:putative 97 kDa heat shock protein [Paratrimastix pyriformis]|uniref:97 kDa heat shock protein n=1 Tax=Paratrimastix pyriformis TaxID=342808 RepID=A0ABQ8UTH8_9EUKA|nr:putative 97 kDa heat shock protein [Paratrimastix pyriformis]